MISTTQYESAAQLYFKQNPTLAQKYYTTTLLKQVVDAMQSSLPTVVSARLAFDRLVANGLPRTDGKSEADDRAEAVAVATANFNAVVAKTDALPLTAAEIQEFSSLGREELSRRYWKDDGMNRFRVRYDRAVREHMFRVPGRIQAVEASAEGEIQLSAVEYFALPTDVLKVRMRDPKWKAAVYRLIKAGQI
jgi:hypothetical protein